MLLDRVKDQDPRRNGEPFFFIGFGVVMPRAPIISLFLCGPLLCITKEDLSERKNPSSVFYLLNKKEKRGK